MTIYLRTASSSESRSHLHLRHRSLRDAEIQEQPGMTPVLAFWPDADAVSAAIKPPLAITPPSLR